MNEHIVPIIGAIGNIESIDENINGVQLIDVAGMVNSAPADTKIIRVQIASPGGLVEVGDQIYNYLNSLKSRFTIVTEQVGDIASIATKIFGVGDQREALAGAKFMIHNPWTMAIGDSKDFSTISEDLKQSENQLIDFYMNLTGLPSEAIAPLMTNEATFSADEAVKLKFATKVISQNKIAAMQKNEIEKMASMFSKMMAFFKTEKPMNMLVELEDGTSLFFQTEDITKLEGVAVMKVDQTGSATQEPADDGQYVLSDHRIVTITGGKVEKVENQPSTPAQQPDAQMVALLGQIELLTKAIESQKQLNIGDVENLIDQKLNSFRSTIKGSHAPIGYSSETREDDIKEWKRSFAANEHMAMRKNDPEKYKKLYYAMYGKMPNI